MSWSNSAHAHSKEKKKSEIFLSFTLYSKKPLKTFSILQTNRIRYTSSDCCYSRKPTSQWTKSEINIKIKTGHRSDPRKGCSLLSVSTALGQILFFFFFLCTFHALFLLSYQSTTPHCPSSHQSCLSSIGCLLWREFLWSGLNRTLWACGHWHSLDRPKERAHDWPRSGFLTLTHYWGPHMSKNVTSSENEGRRWWVSSYNAIV